MRLLHVPPHHELNIGLNFFCECETARGALWLSRYAAGRAAREGFSSSPCAPINRTSRYFFRLEFWVVRIRRMGRKNIFEIKLASFLFLLAMFVVVLGVADHNRKVILSIDEPRQLKN